MMQIYELLWKIAYAIYFPFELIKKFLGKYSFRRSKIDW